MIEKKSPVFLHNISSKETKFGSMKDALQFRTEADAKNFLEKWKYHYYMDVARIKILQI